MLFLDISHIAFMFPFNWSRVNAMIYVGVGVLFLVSSSLVLDMVLFADAFTWVPSHTKDRLLVSVVFGFGCTLEAFILVAIAICSPTSYLVPGEDQNELCERDREMKPLKRSSTGSQRILSRRAMTGKRVSKRDLVNRRGGPLAGQPMDEGNEEKEASEEEEDEDGDDGCDTEEHHAMLNSASGDDVRIHGNMSSFAHTPYIPAKRPDQPTLGHHNSQLKSNSRYRRGYHYQPIASTSTAQSPTFVLDKGGSELPGPSTSRSLSETA